MHLFNIFGLIFAAYYYLLTNYCFIKKKNAQVLEMSSAVGRETSKMITFDVNIKETTLATYREFSPIKYAVKVSD